MSLPKPKPGILEISTYVGGNSDIPGDAKVIKLASNEGALGPSPKAIEAYIQESDKMHRYPDGNSKKDTHSL